MYLMFLKCLLQLRQITRVIHSKNVRSEQCVLLLFVNQSLGGEKNDINTEKKYFGFYMSIVFY